ncbi:hypothetical protein DFJ77DRAFT_443730 [Powellomyces hirtus]|nr:hypothetical protein DFJ77DRAFT_443730 [Powellomyces hirtus]
MTSLFSHLRWTPTDLTPNDLEFRIGLTDLRTDARQMPEPNLGSGSKWNINHLSAFHVVARKNVPLDAVIPKECLPDARDVRSRFPELFALEGDVVRDLPKQNTDLPPGAVKQAMFSRASYFYRALKKAVHHTSNSSVASNTTARSDLTHTTDEDKSENVAEVVLHVLLEFALTDLSPPNAIVRGGRQYAHSLRTDHMSCTLDLIGGIPTTIVSDGTLRLEKVLMPGRSSRTLKDLILAQIDAKRYDKEDLISRVDGRLFAESLAMAMTNATRSTGDQETLVIGIHHRSAFFVHTFFPSSYLAQILLMRDLPPTTHIIMKRSPTFDLLDAQERLTFAVNCVAWFNYTARTDNFVGRLRYEDLNEKKDRSRHCIDISETHTER